MKWLNGIKVIDLSTVLAGPSVGSFLGELGADVIKYESPRNGGDVTRSWRIAGEETPAPMSAYFASINYCKTYGTLDLLLADDRQKLMVELAKADILITNFKASDYKKFELEDDQLRALFPSLIHAQLRGFDSAPERVAYDVVLQAECGMMALNGDPEGEPTKFPIAIVDVLAAHQMKEAILLALFQRQRTGDGATVQVSLEKAGLSALVNQASNYLMTGMLPQRMGSAHPNIAPYGDLFCCKDGFYIVLAVGSDRQFADLCLILGHADLAQVDKLRTNEDRINHRSYLCEQLAQLFSEIESDAFLQACLQHQVPAGLIRTMPTVIELAESLNMLHRERIQGIDTARIRSVGFVIE